MAIVKMSNISIIGMSEDKDAIVRELMSMGIVDITDLSDKAEMDDWKDIVSKDGSDENIDELDNEIQKVKSAIEYLAPYDIAKKPLFAPKKEISGEAYLEITNESSRISDIARKISEFDEYMSRLRSEENRLENLIAALEPWKTYSLPLEITSTNSTVIITGTIYAVSDLKKLQAELDESAPESVLEVINSDRDQIYISVIYHISAEEEVSSILKGYGFARVSFKGMNGTAESIIQNSRKSLSDIDQRRKETREEIISLVSERSKLEAYYDHLVIQRDRKNIKNRMLKTESTFMLEGWFPEKYDEKILNTLSEKFECVIDIRKPAEDEETPVLLKNSPLVQPFELVTELYSLPNSKEIDPNPYMAPFYFIFFGMMVSDAGYGLVISAITGVILLKFKLEGMVSKLMRLLFFGGISTFIWGALFGGWFGDIVQAVTSGRYSIPPLWFNPMENPMKLLLWSLIFGAIQLFVGMGLQGYSRIREGKVLDAIFDTGFWYIFLVGLSLLLVGGIAAAVGKYMAIIGAVLLVITQGRAEKNIIKKFFKGVLSLYNAVGFMSDVLSYSRLLALGLATGVIASVVNAMGTLIGFNVFGFIVMAVVFVVGHVFNLLINAMGAYVHASRLQYVEFFGKFFEGGGKAYQPFKVNTKYININDGRIQ